MAIFKVVQVVKLVKVGFKGFVSKLHVRAADVDQLHFDDQLRRSDHSHNSETGPALDLGANETFKHAESISKLPEQPRRIYSVSVLNKKNNRGCHLWLKNDEI